MTMTSSARLCSSSAASVNSTSLALSSTRRMLLRWSMALSSFRQAAIESRALPRFSFCPGSTPVAMNNPANGCKTYARSLEFLVEVQPLKHAEELVRVLHIETNSVVAHVKDDFVLGVCGPDFDPPLGPSLGEFHSVGNEVYQCQTQHGGIALNGGEVANDPRRLALFRGLLEFSDDLLNEAAEVDHAGHHPYTSHFRKCQKIVDEMSHLPRRGFDDRDEPLALIVETVRGVALQQRNKAGDMTQRSAEVVRDGVGKRLEFVVCGFQLRGSFQDTMLQLLVQRVYLCLRLPPPVVHVMERTGCDPDERAENDDDRQSEICKAQDVRIKSGALALHDQPSDENGNCQSRRQEPPDHDTTAAFAERQTHQPLPRARHKDSEGKYQHQQQRVKGKRTADGKKEYRNVSIPITDQSQ